LVITVPLNFILNKLWAFRSVNQSKDIVDKGMESLK
jgi:putative flippase GtrA